MIFTVANGFGPDHRKAQMSLYSLAIKESGIYKHLFYPSEINTGLFDIIQKTYFDNSGTGKFKIIK